MGLRVDVYRGHRERVGFGVPIHPFSEAGQPNVTPRLMRPQILPELWDELAVPGMTVTMMMW